MVPEHSRSRCVWSLMEHEGGVLTCQSQSYIYVSGSPRAVTSDFWRKKGFVWWVCRILGELCVFAVFWGHNSWAKTLHPPLFWGLNSLQWKNGFKRCLPLDPHQSFRTCKALPNLTTAKLLCFYDEWTNSENLSGPLEMTDTQAHSQPLVNISVETYQILLKATILWVSAAVLLGHRFNPFGNFNLQIGLRRSLRDAWRNVLTAGVKRLIRALKTLLGLSFSIKAGMGRGRTEKASRLEDYVKQKLLLYCHLLVICLYIVVSLTRHRPAERARGRHENRAASGEPIRGSVGADYSHSLKGTEYRRT